MNNFGLRQEEGKSGQLADPNLPGKWSLSGVRVRVFVLCAFLDYL